MSQCRVYWGSHGCRYERGHEGPHECDCAFVTAEDGEEYRLHREQDVYINVGTPPYYGPDTKFYGNDAERHER